MAKVLTKEQKLLIEVCDYIGVNYEECYLTNIQESREHNLTYNDIEVNVRIFHKLGKDENSDL